MPLVGTVARGHSPDGPVPWGAALGLLGHLLRSLQEHFIGEDGQVLADPLPADDALLIHEEERPPCHLAHGFEALDLRAASRLWNGGQGGGHWERKALCQPLTLLFEARRSLTRCRSLAGTETPCEAHVNTQCEGYLSEGGAGVLQAATLFSASTVDTGSGYKTRQHVATACHQ